MIKVDDNLRNADKDTIVEEVKALVENLQLQDDIGYKKYSRPHIVIMMHDVQVVEKTYQSLLKAFKKFSGKSPHDKKYDIRLSKLYFKHISNNSEYANILQQKHANKDKRVLNIYIGTPSRFSKLMDGVIETKLMQHFVIDVTPVGKQKTTTIFEVTQTRDDLYDSIVSLKDRIIKKTPTAVTAESTKDEGANEEEAKQEEKEELPPLKFTLI